MTYPNIEAESPATLLTAGIPDGRENVRTVAEVIVHQERRPEFERVRPLYEFIFYLNHLDYELKVLMDKLLREPKDRAIWLKYLALVLNEALRDVNAIGHGVVKHFVDEGDGRPAHPQVAALTRAINNYSVRVRPVRKQPGFEKRLKEIRDNNAAHHKVKGSLSLQPLVLWTLRQTEALESGEGIQDSEIFLAGLEIGLALQELGAKIQEIILG